MKLVTTGHQERFWRETFVHPRIVYLGTRSDVRCGWFGLRAPPPPGSVVTNILRVHYWLHVGSSSWWRNGRVGSRSPPGNWWPLLYHRRRTPRKSSDSLRSRSGNPPDDCNEDVTKVYRDSEKYITGVSRILEYSSQTWGSNLRTHCLRPHVRKQNLLRPHSRPLNL